MVCLVHPLALQLENPSVLDLVEDFFEQTVESLDSVVLLEGPEIEVLEEDLDIVGSVEGPAVEVPDKVHLDMVNLVDGETSDAPDGEDHDVAGLDDMNLGEDLDKKDLVVDPDIEDLEVFVEKEADFLVLDLVDPVGNQDQHMVVSSPILGVAEDLVVGGLYDRDPAEVVFVVVVLFIKRYIELGLFHALVFLLQ